MHILRTFSHTRSSVTDTDTKPKSVNTQTHGTHMADTVHPTPCHSNPSSSLLTANSDERKLPPRVFIFRTASGTEHELDNGWQSPSSFDMSPLHHTPSLSILTSSNGGSNLPSMDMKDIVPPNFQAPIDTDKRRVCSSINNNNIRDEFGDDHHYNHDMKPARLTSNSDEYGIDNDDNKTEYSHASFIIVDGCRRTYNDLSNDDQNVTTESVTTIITTAFSDKTTRTEIDRKPQLQRKRPPSCIPPPPSSSSPSSSFTSTHSFIPEASMHARISTALSHLFAGDSAARSTATRYLGSLAGSYLLSAVERDVTVTLLQSSMQGEYGEDMTTTPWNVIPQQSNTFYTPALNMRHKKTTRNYLSDRLLTSFILSDPTASRSVLVKHGIKQLPCSSTPGSLAVFNYVTSIIHADCFTVPLSFAGTLLLITAALTKLHCVAVNQSGLPNETNGVVRVRCLKPTRLLFGVCVLGTKGPCTVRFHRSKLQALRKSKVLALNKLIKELKKLCTQFLNRVY